MHGFTGRVLQVDLSRGRSEYRDLREAAARQYLGGVGLATFLLRKHAPPLVDPLSPANPLVITAAPLVGTGVMTGARFAVAAKSPLTGFIGDSLSSGPFALALKNAGIDGLVVAGRAAALACLVVDGERIEVRDARELAGMSSAEADAAVSTALGGAAVSVAAIGSAGERSVRFATISSEGRHAGRGGLGAVMGAKNLKAIAIRGERQASVAHPATVERLAAVLRGRSAGPALDTYRRVGTAADVSVLNRLGALPALNFQQATFDGAHAVSGETLAGTSFGGRHGCACCSIRCGHSFRSRQGASQRLEYQTICALGPLCGIDDPGVVIDAAALCDRYGLDAISTGVTLAWAMEAAERGVLPDARPLGLRFGRGDGLLAGIHAIGARAGVGDLLAEGCRRAAAETGQDSDAWAMHVKGLELPGYEPRSLKATALGLAVNARGACHNRSGGHDADFSGDADRFRGDGSLGPVVAAAEDRAAVLDSLILCRFVRPCLHGFSGEIAEIVSAITGWDVSAAEIDKLGERVCTAKKLFNVREGWAPSDDWLPERLLGEPLATGPCRGGVLSPEELREMIRGYYAARQWDENGSVPGWKVDELGLGADCRRAVLLPMTAPCHEPAAAADSG